MSRPIPRDASRVAGAGTPVQELRALRDEARTLARGVAAEAGMSFADAFGARMMSAYWYAMRRRVRHDLPLAPGFPIEDDELDDDAEQLADRIGAEAARVERLEAGYLLGSIYTAVLPREYRAGRGIYYTPPVVSRRLIEMTEDASVDWASARVLDPACGGGAFLAPVAIRIALEWEHSHEVIDSIRAQVAGWDVDPFGAWMAGVCLEVAVLEHVVATGKRLYDLVETTDSLDRYDHTERYDLVIGNPPYGRTKLSPLSRGVYARSLYGHANLYGLFTDLALRLVEPMDGVVAYVTPTSFLGGLYYNNLRGLLAREAPPTEIDFVVDRKGVFDEVLQETLLATYRRGADGQAVQTNMLMAREDTSAERVRIASVPLPSQGIDPWILPRDKRQKRLIQRLAQCKHRLDDWGYRVSTGPLVWNRHKAQLRHTNDKQNTYPLIWSEAVLPDRGFKFRASKPRHAPFCELRDGDDWLLTTKPCVLVQRTTAKEQPRRLVAAELPQSFLDEHGGAVVENHLNMVRPTNDGDLEVEAGVVSAFLNSSYADAAFRCISGSVAVSAYEIESLPLPDPLSPSVHAVRELVRQNAAWHEIDAAVSAAFEGKERESMHA